MRYTKQNWIFYFRDHYGNETVLHEGKYIRPKQTKYWRQLNDMPNDEVKVIGVKLANES